MPLTEQQRQEAFQKLAQGISSKQESEQKGGGILSKIGSAIKGIGKVVKPITQPRDVESYIAEFAEKPVAKAIYAPVKAATEVVYPKIKEILTPVEPSRLDPHLTWKLQSAGRTEDLNKLKSEGVIIPTTEEVLKSPKITQVMSQDEKDYYKNRYIQDYAKQKVVEEDKRNSFAETGSWQDKGDAYYSQLAKDRLPQIVEEMAIKARDNKRNVVENEYIDHLTMGGQTPLDKKLAENINNRYIQSIQEQDIRDLSYDDIKDVTVGKVSLSDKMGEIPAVSAIYTGRLLNGMYKFLFNTTSMLTPGVLSETFSKVGLGEYTPTSIEEKLYKPLTDNEKLAASMGDSVAFVESAIITHGTLKALPAFAASKNLWGGKKLIQLTKKYPSLVDKAIHQGSFVIPGQAFLEQDATVEGRIKEFVKDMFLAEMFGVASSIQPYGVLSFGIQGGLGYGMARLAGASTEESVAQGLLFAGLQGAGYIDTAKSTGFKMWQSRNTIKKMTGLKIKDNYTDNDLRELWNKSRKELSRKMSPREYESLKDSLTTLRGVSQSARTFHNPIVEIQKTHREIKRETRKLLGLENIKFKPAAVNEVLRPTTPGKPKMVGENKLIIFDSSVPVSKKDIKFLRSSDGKKAYLKRLDSLKTEYRKASWKNKKEIGKKLDLMRGLGNQLGYEGPRITDIAKPLSIPELILKDNSAMGTLVDAGWENYHANKKLGAVRKNISDIANALEVNEKIVAREFIRQSKERANGIEYFKENITNEEVNKLLKVKPTIEGVVDFSIVAKETVQPEVSREIDPDIEQKEKLKVTQAERLQNIAYKEKRENTFSSPIPVTGTTKILTTYGDVIDYYRNELKVKFSDSVMNDLLTKPADQQSTVMLRQLKDILEQEVAGNPNAIKNFVDATKYRKYLEEPQKPKTVTYRVGITTATEKVNEIKKLWDKGKKLEKQKKYNSAEKIFKQIVKPGKEMLEKLFPPNGIKIEEINYSIGRFGNDTEPTLYSKFIVKEESLPEFISKISKIADKDFQQTAVHIHRWWLTEKDGNVKLGIADEKQGISYEPAYDIKFKKVISYKEYVEVINPLIAKYGLPGSTLLPDRSGIEMYNVSAYNKNYEEFKKQSRRFVEDLDSRGLVKGVQEGTRELRSIASTLGDGTTTYERIYSEFRSREKAKGIEPTEVAKEEIKPAEKEGVIELEIKENVSPDLPKQIADIKNQLKKYELVGWGTKETGGQNKLIIRETEETARKRIVKEVPAYKGIKFSVKNMRVKQFIPLKNSFTPEEMEIVSKEFGIKMPPKSEIKDIKLPVVEKKIKVSELSKKEQGIIREDYEVTADEISRKEYKEMFGKNYVEKEVVKPAKVVEKKVESVEEKLLTEARKFQAEGKTLEEFVKAQEPTIQIQKLTKAAEKVSDKNVFSVNWIKAKDAVKGQGLTKDYFIDFLKQQKDNGKLGFNTSELSSDGKGFIDSLIKDGYIRKTDLGERVNGKFVNYTYGITDKVNNYNSKFKSQLIDIWKEAQIEKPEITEKITEEPVTKPSKYEITPVEEPVKPKGKPSKIALSIEAKAIERELTDRFEELAEFDPLTIKEDAKASNDLINSDIERARRIIRGEESFPREIKNEVSLIIAMEERIRNTEDNDLAFELNYELGNSPLVSGTSRAAQTMRVARERVKDSAMTQMQDVKAYRENKVIKVLGKDTDITKVKREITNRIKKEIKKNNLTLTEKENLTWKKFLEGIQC